MRKTNFECFERAIDSSTGNANKCLETEFALLINLFIYIEHGGFGNGIRHKNLSIKIIIIHIVNKIGK